MLEKIPYIKEEGMRLFLSYYSGEESEAEDIADYLGTTFRDQEVEVF